MTGPDFQPELPPFDLGYPRLQATIRTYAERGATDALAVTASKYDPSAAESGGSSVTPEVVEVSDVPNHTLAPLAGHRDGALPEGMGDSDETRLPISRSTQFSPHQEEFSPGVAATGKHTDGSDAIPRFAKKHPILIEGGFPTGKTEENLANAISRILRGKLTDPATQLLAIDPESQDSSDI